MSGNNRFSSVLAIIGLFSFLGCDLGQDDMQSYGVHVSEFHTYGITVNGGLEDGPLDGVTTNGLAPASLVASATEDGVTTNGLDPDGVTTNGTTPDGVTTNGLPSGVTTNSLSLDGIHLNTLGLSGIETTKQGRTLLSYIIGCALPGGDFLEFTAEGITYKFMGGLGLAPSWKHAPLRTDRDVQMISACLLSHVNQFGVAVTVSVRAEGIHNSVDELARFLTYEATFYGDLFSTPQRMYACSGDPAPDFDVAYPDHDTTAGDRLLRRCSDPEGGAETGCGFIYVGACSDVCAKETANGHSHCASDTGAIFDSTMSVWQLAYDDSASVWPELYPVVYGS